MQGLLVPLACFADTYGRTSDDHVGNKGRAL